MSLCLDCGLCCDGGLFPRASLEGGGPRSAVLTPDPENPGFFTQPCVALDGCRCTIYEDRPTACRRFECSALRALNAGQCTREEALEEIAVIKSRRAAVAELLGMPDTGATIRYASRLTREQTSHELREAILRYGTRLQLFIAKL